MLVTLLIMSVFVISAILCHYIAKSRGAKPVFWGILGASLGPLALPFAFASKPEARASLDTDSTK